MSAQPARDIAKVEAYQRPDGEHRCKVTLASGEVVALGSLSRAEVLRAAKVAFPEVSGKAWFKLTTTAITTAIRTKTVPQDVLDGKTAPAAPKPKTAEVPEQAVTGPDLEALLAEEDLIEAKTSVPAPVAEAVATGHDQAAQDLADVISRLVPQAPSIDKDEVRRIVEAHVQKVLVESPVVTVEIKGTTTKKLPKQAHKNLAEVVTILGAGLSVSKPLNLFLVGPAGTGKSTLAHQAAEAITTEAHSDGLPFHALSLGPTTPTSKLFGFIDANGEYRRTTFREVYENGGLFLLDELDNGHPGLVAELNQALANGYAAFADGLVKRHEDALFVATGNTYGTGPDRLFVGRNILDKATLDRFVTVEIGFDEVLERNLALGYADERTTDKVRQYVALVQSVRKSVAKAKLPLVVSPRASIEGAVLIQAGLDPQRVAEIRLYAGWSSEHRAKAGV